MQFLCFSVPFFMVFWGFCLGQKADASRKFDKIFKKKCYFRKFAKYKFSDSAKSLKKFTEFREFTEHFRSLRVVNPCKGSKNTKIIKFWKKIFFVNDIVNLWFRKIHVKKIFFFQNFWEGPKIFGRFAPPWFWYL